MASESKNSAADGDYLAMNSQSLLLLYLADEMPAERRKQLETRLANEPVLRAELENIRLLMEGSDSAIGAADAVGRDSAEEFTAGESAAIRQAARTIRQWTVRRALNKPVVIASKRRFGWRALSAAAVILLAIGYTAWWGISPDAPKPPASPVVLNAQEKMELLAESFDQSALVEPFDTNVATAYSGFDDLDESFDSQLLSVRRGSNLR
jgi:hypothetical protein